ncbi:MAG: hypothetical protein QOC99_2309, partial [Acidobacteriota bacterium]|nr:hypothetical protein [Acidobacteriota bacterium]
IRPAPGAESSGNALVGSETRPTAPAHGINPNEK